MNGWLRLWHDMPTDPKWRTIARVSGQSISTVQAIYLQILVNASENSSVTQCDAGVTQCDMTKRGVTFGLCAEDIASCLDLETEDVECVFAAMQGRVMDGDRVKGWEKRQPIREDNSAERTRRYRENKREERKGVTQCDAPVTQCDAPDTDTDTDTDTTTTPLTPLQGDGAVEEPQKTSCPHQQIIAAYHEELSSCPKVKVWSKANEKNLARRWREDLTRQDLQWWRHLFKAVAESDFLMGRTSRDGPFVFSLGWCVKAENFAKVVNGNYENRKRNPADNGYPVAKTVRDAQAIARDQESKRLLEKKLKEREAKNGTGTGGDSARRAIDAQQTGRQRLIGQ